LTEQVEKPKEPTGTPPEEAPKVDEKKGTPEKAPEAQTSEELEKMKSELGRLKQELGDERKKVEELNPYRLHYEQTQQQQQITPEKINEMWFDNPAKMQQQSEMKIAFQNAQQLAPMAKAVARSQNPAAFEGISDAELDQAMYGGVQTGTVNPGMLTDPNAWVGTAWILRGKQTGYTIPQTGPQNLNPTETEKPSAPTTTDEGDEIPELKGDDLTEAFIEKAAKEGITREQFAKMVHEKRERERR
jgi:hypothetical protein